MLFVPATSAARTSGIVASASAVPPQSELTSRTAALKKNAAGEFREARAVDGRFIVSAPPGPLLRRLYQVAGVPELCPCRVPRQLLRLRIGLPARCTHRALYRVAVDPARKLVARGAGALALDDGKADLLARQHRVLQLHRAPATRDRAFELLEVLVERELVVFRLAVALHLPAPLACRNARNH